MRRDPGRGSARGGLPVWREHEAREEWSRLGRAAADRVAARSSYPLASILPMSFRCARRIAERHGIPRGLREEAADVILAAAIRRWVTLAAH